MISGGSVVDTIRGNSGNGSSITVSGGTITMLYNHKALTITGGSIGNIYNGTGVTVTDGSGGTPTQHVITLVDGASPTTTPVAANAAVTALALSAGSYGVTDMQAGASGKLYVWLPENVAVTLVRTVSKSYSGTSASGADTAFHSIPNTLYWSGAGFFTDAACTVAVNDGDGHPVADMQTILGLVSGDTTIYMKANYIVTGTEHFDGGAVYDVTLKRYSGNTGNLVTVHTTSASLTLDNITLDGGAVWDSADPATRSNSGLTATSALVTNDGELAVGSGTVLQNNDSAGPGAGIYNSGTLWLTGGEITGNTTSATGGGGIYTGGDFNMSGGHIASNYSTADDGTSGVFINTGAAAAILGGMIEDTVRSSGGGGALTISGDMR